MKEPVFIDSNIWLYSFLRQDEEKRKTAKKLIKSAKRKSTFVSTQIINEVCFNFTRDCKILYSEDMQHGQVFEDKLTIKNPFK